MSNHDRRLSRRDAEEILASPAQSDHAVGPVLDAVAAPARPGELLREDAAVAAFHAARLSPATTSRSDSPVPKTTRTAAKAFLATGAVVALTSGGLALAATGHLPTLPDQASDRATEAVAKHATDSPSETASTTATETATETATTTEGASETPTETPSETPTESPETKAAPTPNLEGLCNAFQNGNRTDKGKSLDSAAFAALATAAGGKDAIATYCVSLIGEPRTEKPEPVKPEKTKPAKPAPTKPVKPTTPAKPTNPVLPTKPAKPTTPAKPTNPVLPTKASNPTKPVKTAGGKPEGVGKS
ncbi:hypothetical protein [Nocardioides seonyuensis]|uniref:hypothetical protein n=1 Tax=Nocardioides seonyuensis TaxID=2518371 RepID=UPI00141F3318|nr:hypothetical protein [Nocardioides seonyuensis]